MEFRVRITTYCLVLSGVLSHLLSWLAATEKALARLQKALWLKFACCRCIRDDGLVSDIDFVSDNAGMVCNIPQNSSCVFVC